MKRLNWYFSDGATYSYIDNVDEDLPEGTYELGAGAHRDTIRDMYESHEQLPALVDKHGDITVVFISPA